VSSRDVPNPKPRYVKVGLRAIRRTQAWLGGRGLRGPRWESGVRIFCYHRIASDRGDLAVAPQDFRRHIEILSSFDAQVVSLGEAAGVLSEGRRGRFVCLTFDDGYRDFEEAALPVLREAGFPATVFVTTGFASGTVRMSWFRRQRPVLGWADLERLAKDDLVELGAHTHTHPALPRLTDEEAREEIAAPRLEIMERTGARVDAFAYPAGLYTSRERELVAAAGYAFAVTTDTGVNDPTTSRFALRRTLVEGGDRVSLFEAKLHGFLDEPWEVRRWLRIRVAAGRTVS
jgi:peptidoglycan/xylan/chitin deacetylase (PgdA/CDA1 family)